MQGIYPYGLDLSLNSSPQNFEKGRDFCFAVIAYRPRHSLLVLGGESVPDVDLLGDFGVRGVLSEQRVNPNCLKSRSYG